MGKSRPDLPSPHGDYTAEQWEYIRAMDRWMRKHRIRFPQWSDALAVAIALGYRRVAEPVEPPGPPRWPGDKPALAADAAAD